CACRATMVRAWPDRYGGCRLVTGRCGPVFHGIYRSGGLGVFNFLWCIYRFKRLLYVIITIDFCYGACKLRSCYICKSTQEKQNTALRCAVCSDSMSDCTLAWQNCLELDC